MGLKLDVYADTYSDQFYISTEIENISYAKVKNGVTEYRKAKFKRRKSDNKIVYCIEPFVTLKENTSYKGYDYNYESLLKMSKETWKRISLLAYYGYGYKNHDAAKWYPITQIMIWQTIDKDAVFYWTDSYKGKKVVKYQNEMNEIETLVKNHDLKPSFDNDNYDVSIDSTVTFNDTNNVLSEYRVNSKDLDVKIEGNSLIINTEQKGKFDVELVKEDNIYQAPPIIYVSNTTQNVLSVGGYEAIKSHLQINVDSGSIKILKLDSDTNDITPQGEASLIGAIYEVIDENGEVVGEIEIGEDNTGILEGLKYGKYKIREKSSGKGYLVDKNEYEVTVDSEHKTIEVSLTNEVVKRKIKLHKYYEGDENKKIVEKDIKFQVIDRDGKVYKEIMTDAYGEVEFELPYGTYTIKQINTTTGYAKVDDFSVTIDENSSDVLEYYLNDLKIPNTYQKSNDLVSVIIMSLVILLSIYSMRHENV